MAQDLVLDVEGMTCASCVSKVERALRSVDSVDEVSVNLVSRRAAVRAQGLQSEPLIAAVRRAGYDAHVHDQSDAPADEAGGYLRRLIVAAPLTIAVLVLTFVFPGSAWSGPLAWILSTPVVLYGGWPFFTSAFRAARHLTTTMDTLVAIGAAAAYGQSAWGLLAGRDEHYFDTAAVIVTLILVGKYLEAKARANAGDAARILLERGAKEATILVDGTERRVPVDELVPGTLVVVRPGEKVPADGVVKEGSSWTDLSLLTGESVPADVGPGDEVVGAAVNGSGRLVVFVTRTGENTKLAEIARLVEAAQGSRAPIQRLADRVSSVFVPVVLVVAAATFGGWLVRDPGEPGAAILNAIAVLLIACPCALGLATPAAIMAGAGRAAQLGVLFGDGGAIEAMRRSDVVLLDKTGTVTRGSMSVSAVVPAPGEQDTEVLALAAAAEGGSEHPIAAAVIEEARARGLHVPAARDHRVHPGAGAEAVVDGALVRVGRPDELPVHLEEETERLAATGATVFSVRRDELAIGIVAVLDEPKPGAAEAVARIRASGSAVAMVSGDRRGAAEAIAAGVGIDRVLAEVMPEGKVAEVARLQGVGHRVVFVGDGINDAPALAAADVGVAVGTGTDVALAAADVRLLGPGLGSVADALDLARQTYRVIQQNLFWAFAYNVVMIPLAISGALNPMWAAAAMALSSVSVVANALRLGRFGRDGRNTAGPWSVVTGDHRFGH